MKPYETLQDLENERKVIEILAKEWGCGFSKLSIKYGADFALTKDGKVIAWVEVKRRSFASSGASSVILTAEKWVKMQLFASATHTKAIFALKLLDGVFWSDETGREREIEWGGRTDRNDPDDMEPVIVIPMTDFKRVKGT